MERKTPFVLAFVGGIVIGLNWHRIKRASVPIFKTVAEGTIDGCVSAVRFIVEQKERLEDQRAARNTNILKSIKKPNVKAKRGARTRRG